MINVIVFQCLSTPEFSRHCRPMVVKIFRISLRPQAIPDSNHSDFMTSMTVAMVTVNYTSFEIAGRSVMDYIVLTMFAVW